MSSPTEIFAGAASTALGGVAGSKIAVLLADATPLPDWTAPILGPLGTLVGVLIALKWMAGRLAHAEAREEKRSQDRDDERKQSQETLISLIKDSNSICNSAVHVMREVTDALNKCPGPRHKDHNQD